MNIQIRAKKQSKIQQRYEQLLNEIDKRKKYLHHLEEQIQKVQPRIQGEIVPLIRKQSEKQLERILKFDKVANEIGVPKSLKKSFEDYMLSEISSLIVHYEKKLFDLYQKYAGQNYVSEKNIIQVSEEEEEDFEPEDNIDEEAFKHIKSSKPLTKKDAKAIYLQLMKRFHPDKTQELSLKDEYTLISTKVTKAFQANDFLELLKLQMEYIEEDESTDLSIDFLKRYSRVLQQQLDQTNAAIDRLETETATWIDNFFDTQLNFSEKRFKNFKKQVKKRITYLENDFVDSHSYPEEWFKQWLNVFKNADM